MPKPFPFTEAKVKALGPPTSGRVYHRDTRFPGLQLCVTAAGSKTYYFVKRLEGTPTRVILGPTSQLSLEAARTAAGAVTGDVAAGRNPQAERRQKREEPTLQALWEHWLLYAKAHKKPGSVYEDSLKWNKFLKPWAHRRLTTIKKTDMQSLHAQVGRENGIYQANRLLALIRAMLNKSDELGHRGDNPAKGIKLFKEQSRDRFLQPDELTGFFAALEAEDELVRDFYLVALLTGARRSNVQTMRWEDVDLNAGYWRIPQTKAGMAVLVPLGPPARSILAARHANGNGPWVFPGRNGKHLANPKGAWARVCTTAGLKNLHPHDLRRSLGSWMAGQNTSLTIIGRLLGHRTPQATMVYSRLSLDPVRQAMDRATTAILVAGGQTKLLEAQVEKGRDDATQAR